MIQNKSIFASLPRTQRGMPLVLGGDPKGKNFLYTNGNFVIIRNIDNPAIADIYTEHSAPTTVAKYSPSGFYICSADQSGKVRIWDTTQKEHILKNEFQPFVGTIKDLSWSPDSQRIVAVGEGREKFGHVFMMDTGTSVGEISGHSKIINSCDFKPTRPYRIITGGEDNIVGVLEGPPFKFKLQLENHSKFVQSVRYSPDGEHFVTAGFDGRIFIFTGKDYQFVGELGSPAHSGGVYCVCWSPDSTRIMSCSGDRTVKIWDMASKELIQQYHLGDDLLDQQVSCLWQGQHLLSVSLSGFINYLDINDTSKPLRVIKGHSKSITALTVHTGQDGKKTLYTGSHEGPITHWNSDNGENDRIIGKGHTNQVSEIRVRPETGEIYTIAYDDLMKIIDPLTHTFKDEQIKLPSQPRAMDFMPKDKSKAIVAAYSEILIINLDSKKVESKTPVNYEPTSIAVHPNESHVAVGGQKDKKVHVYLLNESGNSISPKVELDHREGVSDVSYSPDGTYLAAADANRKVLLYRADTYELAHNIEWGFHTAKVNCLAWSPDSVHLASGSLDTAIIIWNALKPNEHIMLKKAHPQSQITRIAWMDENTIVTTGQDSNTKIWSVTYKK